MSMNRRGVIEAIGVGGLTVLAGCSSNSSDDQSEQVGEEPDEETPDEETPDEETPDEEAEFEFVEWNVPSEVELNEEFDLRVVVANTGGEAGDFTAPLYARTPESDWSKVSELDFETIPPDTQTEVSLPVVYAYINRYELRLGNFEQTTVLQTVSAQIDWGGKYITPSGYVIRADEPELQDSYEYEGFTGELSQKEPDSGGQWVFVNMYVKNETGQVEYSPSNFALVTGNSQYDSEIILAFDPINQGDEFEGGELQPGIERSGWIAYQIPSNISVSDLTLAWSKTTFNGEIVVNWGSG